MGKPGFQIARMQFKLVAIGVEEVERRTLARVDFPFGNVWAKVFNKGAEVTDGKRNMAVIASWRNVLRQLQGEPLPPKVKIGSTRPFRTERRAQKVAIEMAGLLYVADREGQVVDRCDPWPGEIRIPCHQPAAKVAQGFQSG